MQDANITTRDTGARHPTDRTLVYCLSSKLKCHNYCLIKCLLKSVYGFEKHLSVTVCLENVEMFPPPSGYEALHWCRSSVSQLWLQ